MDLTEADAGVVKFSEVLAKGEENPVDLQQIRFSQVIMYKSIYFYMAFFNITIASFQP